MRSTAGQIAGRILAAFLLGGVILAAFPVAYIVINLVGMACFALFPLTGPDSPYAVWGWRVPFVLGALLAGVLVLYYVRRDIDLSRRFDWRLFRQVLVYGIKLATTNLLLVLTGTLSVMLLRYLRQEQFTDVGLYTRAVAICSLARLVPIAVGPMLYAKWAASEGDVRTRQVEMAARMAAAYGLLAACIVVLLGKQILWLMYGEAFVPAHAALVFLAPAFVCMTVFGILSNFLASDGRAATTACILVGTVTMITVVTWLAVPTWGIQDAALGALLGNALAMASGLVVCRKLYGLKALNCLRLGILCAGTQFQTNKSISFVLLAVVDGKFQSVGRHIVEKEHDLKKLVSLGGERILGPPFDTCARFHGPDRGEFALRKLLQNLPVSRSEAVNCPVGNPERMQNRAFQAILKGLIIVVAVVLQRQRR